jgi:two-component system, chemotaxis family, protein-glutamate methylesterase/glutaminase
MAIRVLVVDDSAFVRKALTRVLNQDPDVVVVAQAADGREAIEKIHLVSPDVVTLDLEMPRLNGLSTIKEVMASCPLPIVVLSAWAQKGAEVAVRALELGAVEVIDKGLYARMDIHLLARDLLQKIKAVVGARPRTTARPASVPVPALRTRSGGFQAIALPPSLPAPWSLSAAELVCVGASTGGPQAIQDILSALPRDFGAPVAVVQHMPPGFTRLFAERLDSLGGLRVREAEERMRLLPGQVVIAKAGLHLQIERDAEGLYVHLTPLPSGPHVPSADTLLESAARICGNRAVGVLLTGMGQDGARGMVQLRKTGATTIGEAEESCVVYGMPRAAHEAGGIELLLPLPRIPSILLARVQGPRG